MRAIATTAVSVGVLASTALLMGVAPESPDDRTQAPKASFEVVEPNPTWGINTPRASLREQLLPVRPRQPQAGGTQSSERCTPHRRTISRWWHLVRVY